MYIFILGDNTTMLFTLSPTINCFHTTGYNDHYQYLNLHQETMPNGLVSVNYEGFRNINIIYFLIVFIFFREWEVNLTIGDFG